MVEVKYSCPDDKRDLHFRNANINFEFDACMEVLWGMHTHDVHAMNDNLVRKRNTCSMSNYEVVMLYTMSAFCSK